MNAAQTRCFYERNNAENDYWSALESSTVELYFIGASVTAQKFGWADRLHTLLNEVTCQKHVLFKNAMGGVGLLFGCANYQVPTSSSNRQIVFIEFSTGDLNLGTTPLEELDPLLTALIERVLLDKGMPIIVHNWRADFRGASDPGVRKQYDEVARRYSVPVIYNNHFVDSVLNENGGEEASYFRDVCHTTADGAQLYADHVLEALKRLSRADSSNSTGNDRRQEIIGCGDLPRTVQIPVGSIGASDYVAGSYRYPNTDQVFDYIELSQEGQVHFRATGRLMGVGFLSGPRSGWVDLRIDGKLAKRFRCFGRNSYYERYVLFSSFFDLNDAEVEIGLSNEPVDFSIAKNSHPDFDLPRKLQLVHLVGKRLLIVPSGS
jgi:hypothetical protein